MSRRDENLIKLFAISNQTVEHNLDQIEREYGIDLGRGHVRTLSTDQTYYPQIEKEIRAEAALMAPHYEVFYSLENTIRALIDDTLTGDLGQEWWDTTHVPEKILHDCEARRKNELDTGLTPRSDRLLDYSTFGELNEIIKKNWDVVGQSLRSLKSVERVLALLNTLRGPIAHCSPLADDEVVRLRLAVRDWFRLME